MISKCKSVIDNRFARKKYHFFVVVYAAACSRLCRLSSSAKDQVLENMQLVSVGEQMV